MRRRTPLLTVLACTVVCSAPLAAQERIPASQLRFTKAVEVVRLIEAFEAAKLGDVGCAIEDLTTGKTFQAAPDATKPFIPASNQKLLTTAFALERLGADFRFTTAVVQLGDDLVLTGDADPTLGDPTLAARNKATIYAELDRWAAEVHKQLGSRIAGDIVLRVQVPKGAYFNPDWAKRHLGKRYAPPVAALNFHHNCYDVTFREVPDPAAAETVPAATQPTSRPTRIEPIVVPTSRFIRVQNATKRGGKHEWRISEADNGSHVNVLGTVKSASKDPLPTPVKNPPMLLGRVFADRLIQAGVIYGGSIVAKPAADLDLSKGKVLAGTRTPLATALTLANRDSLNLAADCVYLRAGDGSWDGSGELMQKTLVDRHRLDADALTVRDGSGLAGGNRVSPTNLVKLLSALARGTDAKLVLGTLARNGKSGTLDGRMDDEAIAGRIAAKTGTLANVSALSGYVLDDDGKPAVAFSVLVNNVRDQAKARKLQDDICRLLIEHVDR